MPCTSAPASTSSAASRSAFGVVFEYWKRPVSVTSADVERLGDLGRQRDVELAEQVADDLGGRRRVGDDQVDVAEARVVVVVVDVDDERGALERSPVSWPMRRAFAQSTASSTRSSRSAGRLAQQVVEREEAVLGRQRRVAGEEHDDVLAERAQRRASSPSIEPSASPSGFSCVTTRKRSCVAERVGDRFEVSRVWSSSSCVIGSVRRRARRSASSCGRRARPTDRIRR